MAQPRLDTLLQPNINLSVLAAFNMFTLLAVSKINKDWKTDEFNFRQLIKVIKVN